MLKHPNFDPVALSLGKIKIHWYGLMYLFGFLAGLMLGKLRARQAWRGWSQQQVEDILFYIVMGIILGGRIGSVLFYNMDTFLADPLYLVRIWDGGMSFHGGFLGVVFALWLFARKHNKHFLAVGDFIAPLVPPGIAFGRFGNFINGELWGRQTDVAWGMLFRHDPDGVLRHPSQLYQMAGEGIALFLILWWYSSKPRPRSAVAGAFLFGYGVFRTIAEFFREPDAHIGFLAFDFLTMGMLLSMPMIVLGGAMLVYAYRKPVYDQVESKA
mgnify:CR=1 FL=1